MQRKPLTTASLIAVLVSLLLTRSHTAASSERLPQPDLTAPEVMENVRKAVHFSAYVMLPRGIQLHGTASAWGEKGTYALISSGTGPFVLTYTFPMISKSPQTGAFDGQMHWSADWTGANSVNDPGTGGERQLFVEAQMHGWLDPPVSSR